LTEQQKPTRNQQPQDFAEQIQQWLDLSRELGITEFYKSKVSGKAEVVSNTHFQELEDLRLKEIGNCVRCKLHKTRKTIVFGEGNPSADLMLIGEAPGADEDVQGRPFVGRAGQLLMQMIKAIGFQRSDVFIANVLKCRPPENRNPEMDEIAECSPFLWKQIAMIQPKVIIVLGTFSAQLILNSKSSISSLRNRVYDMPFGKVVATYHPSFLLRSPQKKPEAWEDLKLVKKTLDES
jgi:uracil-DNA glycosylase family 4